jgi:cytochrome c-type biogenesis protein CcmH/NrfG
MKRTIEPNITAQSEFAQLRELLDDTERQVVEMHKTPAGAYEVIRNLDELEGRLHEAEKGGVDLRAEEGRMDGLRRRLMRGAPGVVRMVQASEHAAALHNSPTYQAVLAAQLDESRRRVRRLLTIGLPVLAVMLTIIVLTLLNPPPPQANLNPVRQLAADGRLEDALARAQSEVQRVPSDAEAVLWVGSLQLASGNTAAAEQSWATARQLLGDETRFHFERGNALLGVAQTDAAEQDARWLIERPETAAPGYLLLGGVEEMRGRVPEAIQAFETSADLASKAGNTQLEVIAKTRLGFLMQSAPMMGPTATP